MNQSDNPSLLSPELVPEAEIEALIQLIRKHPEYTSTDYIREAYQSLGLEVFADPLNRDVADRVSIALQTGTPYSVIRLGDGEMNLLSFSACAETPSLDRYGSAATIHNQGGSFYQNDIWMLALREMMMSAVLQADIVGVLGLWRPLEFNIEGFINALRSDLRGLPGHWRGMHDMLRIARTGALQNKIVASAHLYFGLISHMDHIFSNTRRILLITDRGSVVKGLMKKYPDHRFEHILLGSRTQTRALSNEGPRFLLETEALLATRDLRGCCGLVGAGPWAEIYCTWIKQRGGVGLDIGSGFDLLAGIISRPIHRCIGLEIANPYSL